MKKLDFVVEVTASLQMEVADDFDCSDLIVGKNVPQQIVVDALIHRIKILNGSDDIGEAISISDVVELPL